MKYKGHKFHLMLGKSPLFFNIESTRNNFYLKIKFIVFNFFRLAYSLFYLNYEKWDFTSKNIFYLLENDEDEMILFLLQ